MTPFEANDILHFILDAEEIGEDVQLTALDEEGVPTVYNLSREALVILKRAAANFL